MNGMPADLVCELLRQSLAAWRLQGHVVPVGGAIMIGRDTKHDVRIEAAPQGSMFRWTVTIAGRRRMAVSLPAVLRQVREAFDPDYAANRIRVAVMPLSPS
jgi:hypothetical protein